MVKKLLVSLCVLCLSLSMFGCGKVSSQPNSSNSNNTQGTKTSVTEEKAKEIALEHANISAKDATFEKVELDHNNGVSYYEVEFRVGDQEYDYEINASTGEISSYDHEINDANITQDNNLTTNDSTSENTTTVQPTDITVEQAKTAALNHAGVKEADATFERAEIDTENGSTCYEIEFTVGTKEYDYDVDIKTGEVKAVDHEINNDGVNSTSPVNE